MTKNRLLTKVAMSVIVLIVIIAVTTLYSPVIGSNFAVDQLKDVYQSNVGIKAWQAFKDFWVVLYIGFNTLLFKKELVTLAKRINK